MTKTKILAFIALGAILSACASDDDGAPPKLVSSPPNLIISPFDTLVVKFDSKLVDLDTSGESNVILGNGKKWINKDKKPRSSGKEFYFVGTNTTLGGSNYFTGGTILDSIVFKNIRNSDDYKTSRAVFYFSTNKIWDREPNNKPENANDIEELSGEKITDGITFTGVLDKKGMNEQGYPISDDEDYYKLNLKHGDSISITVTNTIKNKPTPLKVRFRGGCIVPPCNDKIDSTSSKNRYSVTLKDTIKAGHLGPEDVVGKISPFYIDILDNTDNKPNPYLVTVKKL